MTWGNRKWVILTKSEADAMTDVNQSEVLDTSWNLANDAAMVKYEGAKPQFLSGKDTLSWAQALETLVTSEWYEAPNI